MARVKDWQQSEKGNFYCFTTVGGEKQVVTVFESTVKYGPSKGDIVWKFVCDGEFSDDGYDTAEEAMEAAEEVYP